MSTDFPTTAEITSDVLRALKATGVDTDAVAGDTEVRTPITGECDLRRCAATPDDDVDAAIAEAAEAFTTWREVPRTGARPAGQALGRAADRAQAGSGHAGHGRGRQDHLGGAR